MVLNDAVTRSELLRGVLGVAAAAGSFRAGAAIAVVGQPAMPPLGGRFEHIGVRYVRCADARVKVFFPCAPPGQDDLGQDTLRATAAARYCTDGRETSDGMAGLVGFKQLGLSFLLQHLADAPSGCLLDARPLSAAETGGSLPLLCYSHGFGGNMDMATYMMREFASHGAVVAAVEHTDGTASSTRLPSGETLPFSPQKYTRREQLQRRAAELLAAAEPDALGADLPIERGACFLGGHSYGGPSALLAAALPQASRLGVRGLVLHDPALGMNGGIDAAIGRGADGRLSAAVPPTLSFVSDEYDRAGVQCGVTFHTVGGFHGNFVDAPLWAPRWVMRPLSAVIPAAGPCDAAELHTTLAATGTAFMSTIAADPGLRGGGGGGGGRRGGTAAAACSSPPFSSRLLELRGGCGGTSPLSPSGALLAWRSHRLRAFADSFDASRYHAQVLFVDDDGRRARTCEAMLERVALWADAGWWIYPHSASTANNVADGEAAPRSLLATAASYNLCATRLSAPAATIEAEDLLSYDLVVAVDYEVLSRVKALARELGDASVDDHLLCLTDFLAYDGVDGDGTDQRMDALDDEMRSLIAPHYARGVAGLTELPSVGPRDPDAWERLLAATALSCSGLTVFLKDAIDAWFLRAYDELLHQLYGSRSRVENVSWKEAEEVLRSHIVTGGLDGQVRRRLFEEHRERLLRGSTEGEGPPPPDGMGA